jgi:superfamily I DNA and/or RNA helicase
MLRLAKKQSIDLYSFDFLENKPAFHYLAALIEQKARITLCSSVDSRVEANNKVSRQLLDLQRMDKFIFEERGAKDLYVGYPFVHGKMLDDTIVRAPLLFFPVELQREGNKWVICVRQESGISFNKTLLLAFSHYNNIAFEEKFLDFDFEDFPNDPQNFLVELYHLLQKSPLELNFNQETFGERILPFEEFRKEDFTNLYGAGQLKLIPEAVLGIFPQADSNLMPDYDFLIKSDKIKDLEDFFMPLGGLADNPELQKTVVSKAASEEELMTPFPLDASQEQAIKKIKSGYSLVIQGPPGSGKSQLICNLIADYMARGKNVLLVCQKRAALDVVYRRLSEVGLADFAALVHDFRNDRRVIYENISRQIQKIEQYQSLNQSLDVIHLERRFLQISREIEAICQELEEFKYALYLDSEFGISAKQLYLISDLNAPSLPLKEEYVHFHYQHLSTFLQKLNTFAKYALQLDQPEYAWAIRKPFHHFSVEDFPKMKELLPTILPDYQSMAKEIHEVVGVNLTMEECFWFLEKETEIRKMLEILLEPVVYQYFKQHLKQKEGDINWLLNAKKNFMGAYGEEGLETSIAQQDLWNCQKALNKAKRAGENLISRIKWEFSDEKVLVSRLIVRNGVKNHPNAIDILMRKIDHRMNFEHNLTDLKSVNWLFEFPESYEKEKYEKWFDQHLQALEAKKLCLKLRNGLQYLDFERHSYDELFKKLDRLLNIVKELPQKKESWLQYLHEIQLKDLLSGKLKSEDLLKALEQDFDALGEYDRLHLNLAVHERHTIYKLFEKQPLPKFEQKEEWLESLQKLLTNSLYIAWLNHLEIKYPILRIVSSQRLVNLESTLQQHIAEKQEIVLQIVLMKIREKTFNELEFNRLNNRVTFRDLQHQVEKKRNVFPLRKLIENFSHELFRLVPCWMASPDSVSAIFPMMELFDLVVFDEASQCFAERGIPAMYRGKQVVIAGDTQQLSPFDLYQTRLEDLPTWEENMDEDIALEFSSLLDLGSRYLATSTLTGHYRSKSLELIEFSNRHFYGGKLQFLPDYHTFSLQEPSIQFIKVEGIWEDSCNVIEAQRVANLVKTLILAGKYDIGIITFNFRQQELIQDLLEEGGMIIPKELFVKNIENVQGDEREIIIFSIGYAPTPTGVIRLQFGSLNLQRGENRLNVAITRAKEKVYVVSSLYPNQLHVEETINMGAKLLKGYLQYAYEVSQKQHKVSPKESLIIPTEWQLKRKIAQLSPENSLSETLPFADLAVISLPKEEEKTDTLQYNSLILTDDQPYFESITPKDVHAYLPMLFRAKGWKHQRFFSREYWRNRELFAEELKKMWG